MSKEHPLYCSFCGKSENEVQVIVAGPTAARHTPISTRLGFVTKCVYTTSTGGVETMFLRTEFSTRSVGSGGRPRAPRPEPLAVDPPDVAALFYITGRVLVRVMLEDGLTGRPA